MQKYTVAWQIKIDYFYEENKNNNNIAKEKKRLNIFGFFFPVRLFCSISFTVLKTLNLNYSHLYFVILRN